ncbi:hypothetical protein [Paraclostridium bifermentans]
MILSILLLMLVVYTIVKGIDSDSDTELITWARRFYIAIIMFVICSIYSFIRMLH